MHNYKHCVSSKPGTSTFMHVSSRHAPLFCPNGQEWNVECNVSVMHADHGTSQVLAQFSDQAGDITCAAHDSSLPLSVS